MDNKEPLLRSDWTIYRGGAVTLTGTEDVSLRDCVFDQPGGNAVFVNHYNRRTLVKGCHIREAGAGGVCFVGDPKAVRNPLFEYAQKHDFAKLDLTPGPKSDNYPADCAVEDCLIQGIGRVDGGGQLVSVAPGSPAEKAGLKENDLIQALDGKPTRDLDAVFQGVAGARERKVGLSIVRDQKPLTHVIDPGAFR